MPAERFVEMRRAGMSLREIADSVGWSLSLVCYWGQLVLPSEMREVRGKYLPDVLPPAEFSELRAQGLSYPQVAERKGLRTSEVAQYGRVALPAELRTRRSSREWMRGMGRCERCSMLEDPGNLLEMVEVELEGQRVTQQWCALCRLEGQGVKLLDFFESGAALEYEEETGERVWIV